MSDFGVLLVSHGKYAKEALKSAEMIAGKTDNFLALELDENKSKQQFREEVLESLEKLHKDYDTVLCLCDIYGGTPFNVILELLMNGASIKAYVGFNLPMILELCMLDTVDKNTIPNTLKEIYNRSFMDLDGLVSNQNDEFDL